MQVGVPLAVTVAWHVDGNTVDRKGDIGAVVGVETAQEELIRFAPTLVLSSDQPGHDLDDRLGISRWPNLKVALPDGLCRGGGGRSGRLDSRFEDVVILSRRGGRSIACSAVGL